MRNSWITSLIILLLLLAHPALLLAHPTSVNVDIEVGTLKISERGEISNVKLRLRANLGVSGKVYSRQISTRSSGKATLTQNITDIYTISNFINASGVFKDLTSYRAERGLQRFYSENLSVSGNLTSIISVEYSSISYSSVNSSGELSSEAKILINGGSYAENYSLSFNGTYYHGSFSLSKERKLTRWPEWEGLQNVSGVYGGLWTYSPNSLSKIEGKITLTSGSEYRFEENVNVSGENTVMYAYASRGEDYGRAVSWATASGVIISSMYAVYDDGRGSAETGQSSHLNGLQVDAGSWAKMGAEPFDEDPYAPNEGIASCVSSGWGAEGSLSLITKAGVGDNFTYAYQNIERISSGMGAHAWSRVYLPGDNVWELIHFHVDEFMGTLTGYMATSAKGLANVSSHLEFAGDYISLEIEARDMLFDRHVGLGIDVFDNSYISGYYQGFINETHIMVADDVRVRGNEIYRWVSSEIEGYAYTDSWINVLSTGCLTARGLSSLGPGLLLTSDYVEAEGGYIRKHTGTSVYDEMYADSWVEINDGYLTASSVSQANFSSSARLYSSSSVNAGGDEIIIHSHANDFMNDLMSMTEAHVYEGTITASYGSSVTPSELSSFNLFNLTAEQWGYFWVWENGGVGWGGVGGGLLNGSAWGGMNGYISTKLGTVKLENEGYLGGRGMELWAWSYGVNEWVGLSWTYIHVENGMFLIDRLYSDSELVGCRDETHTVFEGVYAEGEHIYKSAYAHVGDVTYNPTFVSEAKAYVEVWNGSLYSEYTESRTYRSCSDLMFAYVTDPLQASGSRIYLESNGDTERGSAFMNMTLEEGYLSGIVSVFSINGAATEEWAMISTDLDLTGDHIFSEILAFTDIGQAGLNVEVNEGDLSLDGTSFSTENYGFVNSSLYAEGAYAWKRVWAEVYGITYVEIWTEVTNGWLSSYSEAYVHDNVAVVVDPFEAEGEDIYTSMESAIDSFGESYFDMSVSEGTALMEMYVLAEPENVLIGYNISLYGSYVS
ncbi:MAG: hypothetical protein DRN00_04510, partial [Thermoplasmata archaeon]